MIYIALALIVGLIAFVYFADGKANPSYTWTDRELRMEMWKEFGRFEESELNAMREVIEQQDALIALLWYKTFGHDREERFGDAELAKFFGTSPRWQLRAMEYPNVYDTLCKYKSYPWGTDTEWLSQNYLLRKDDRLHTTTIATKYGAKVDGEHMAQKSRKLTGQFPQLGLAGPTVEDDVRRLIGRYGAEAVKKAVTERMKPKLGGHQRMTTGDSWTKFSSKMRCDGWMAGILSMKDKPFDCQELLCTSLATQFRIPSPPYHAKAPRQPPLLHLCLR